MLLIARRLFLACLVSSAAPSLLAGCVAHKALAEICVARHLNAGLAALQAQDGRRAAAELERVLRVEPDHAEARQLVAKAYCLSKQYAKALPILETQPPARRTLDDWFLLGDAYDAVNRRDTAERAYRQAVDLARLTSSRTGLAVALNNLGYRLADRGERLDEALALIQEADNRLPNQGFIVDSLAWVHYRRGEHRLALLRIDRACELSPWVGELRYHRGMILLKNGRRKEAIDEFGLALFLDPADDKPKQELRRLRIDPEKQQRQARKWRWRRHWWVLEQLADQLAKRLVSE